MEENANAPVEKKPERTFSVDAPEMEPTKGQKAGKFTIYFLGAVAGATAIGFFSLFFTPARNAPLDENGRNFTLLQKYFTPGVIENRIDEIKQDSIAKVKRDSTENAQKVADSIAQAKQDSVDNAKAGKKRRTSQNLDKDTKGRQAFAINLAGNQAVLRQKNFQGRQMQKLKC